MKQDTHKTKPGPFALPTSSDGIIIQGTVAITVTCTCGEWIAVTVKANDDGSDYEELKDIAYDEAGFSETGACWTCALASAQEDLADQQMRDRKSNMEGSVAR
jgi:hypothetical protein